MTVTVPVKLQGKLAQEVLREQQHAAYQHAQHTHQQQGIPDVGSADQRFHLLLGQPGKLQCNGTSTLQTMPPCKRDMDCLRRLCLADFHVQHPAHIARGGVQTPEPVSHIARSCVVVKQAAGSSWCGTLLAS